MAESTSTPVVFDPIKLERVKVGSDYPMEKADFDELFNNARYCDMAHISAKGYPIVTPMFYVVVNGHIHVSSIKSYRYKVHALEKRPNMSVVIHNDGMALRHQKAILVVGKAKVSDDEELKTNIHWAIINKYWVEITDPIKREEAFKAVHTPLRAIIEVIPENIISWDFGKMVNAYDPGVWFNEAYKFPHRGGAAVKG